MKNLFTVLFTCICFGAVAQDFYDMSTIQTIEVYLSQSNWDEQLDNAYSTTGDYIMADSVIINEITFDSVGVKYKGNSSYKANQIKNPWHIELDTYKDQDYEGYKDIKLANVYNDPSFLRDVLGYYIARKYMDAPLANYANLYVNGTLIGLYSNTEAISKTFVKDRFGSKKNTFFSCSPPEGADPRGGEYPNLVYLGEDSSDYYDAYEMKSDEGWEDLITLCYTLENNTASIEEILDTDRALWMLAFDNSIVNLDSYIGIFSQNYYLYRDDYGRFLPVVWDLNESFGVFSQTGTTSLNNTSSKQQMSHFLHSSDTDWPLIKNLLSISAYKKKYLAHMKTILKENFDNDSYYTTAQDLQTLISSDVQADNNKFYTYNEFISNLTSDITSGQGPMQSSVPGITNLMDARSDYLLALTDFTNTEPAISTIAVSDPEPETGQSVYISASVTEATNVYLNYRTGERAPFTVEEMYDDGLHNDGAENDGVYGAEISSVTAITQYYIYAENSNIGKFSPERAAFEFYSFESTISESPASDIVINEFLASNETSITDQDGEFDDWIELFNNGSETTDIGGYYLSDDTTDLKQWQFPEGTQIASGEYLLIWADKDSDQEGLHAEFKLSASGESIVLSNTSGTVIDLVNFPEQETDISYGRYPNGTGNFEPMTPSPQAENTGTTHLTKYTEETFKLRFFPNPTDGLLNISADELITEIIVYSLSGQVLKSISPNNKNVTMDLSKLDSGINLIRVHTNQGNTQIQKIIIK